MLEVQLNGFAELEQQLQEFAAKVQANALRGALRAGQKPIRQAILSRVPVAAPSFGNKSKYGAQAGDLAASVGKIRTFSRNGQTVGVVKVGNSRAWYAHFVEFGTTSHYITAKPGSALNVKGTEVAKVLHPGAKKHPFMRPVFDDPQVQAASLEAFRAYMAARIEKEKLKLEPSNDAS